MVLLEQFRGQGREVGARGRALATSTALVLLEPLALVATRNAWREVRAPGPASLDEAVVLVVLTACAVLGGWVVLSTTVAVLAHLPGRLGHTAQRWAGSLAPAATRRLAALLVGAALGSAVVPAGVAGAAAGDAAPQRVPGFTVTLPSPVTTHPGATEPPAPASASVPEPGWTPSRPVHAPAPAAARLVTGGTTPTASEVVVHRGDSLWTIARRHLGPGATDVEVAAAWPQWYATNRDVIGPDPDVLLPGQVLHAPDPRSTASDPGYARGARR
jgi:hypothetical protein